MWYLRLKPGYQKVHLIPAADMSSMILVSCISSSFSLYQAHAERMDEWIVWEAEEEEARRNPGL
jgi:hypothetical protein